MEKASATSVAALGLADPEKNRVKTGHCADLKNQSGCSVGRL